MTLRQPLWQRLGYLLGLGAPAIVLAVGVALGDAPLFAAVGSLLLVAAVWRIWVTRVEVGDDLRLVGLTGTRVLAWADVERFDFDAGTGTVAAWSRDGRRHRIDAFSGRAPLPSGRRRQEEVVRRLDQARLRRETATR